MKFIPYLMAENALEALELYTKVFNGKIEEIHYGNEVPGMEQSAEAAKIIINAKITIGDNIIFLADSIPEGSPFCQKTTYGNNISITVAFDSEEELLYSYNKLKDYEGSVLVSPLETAFWGGKFAMIQDKFKITWQLSCDN